MQPVIFLIDELPLGQIPECELHQGDGNEHDEMEREEARETQFGEFSGAHAVLRDGVAIEPEKDETGEGEEQIDRDEALSIERFQNREEGLSLRMPSMRPQPVERVEMLPVPDHHREGGEAAQRVQGIEPLCAGQSFARALYGHDFAVAQSTRHSHCHRPLRPKRRPFGFQNRIRRGRKRLNFPTE